MDASDSGNLYPYQTVKLAEQVRLTEAQKLQDFFDSLLKSRATRGVCHAAYRA